jgi:hypothetical protein
MNHDYPTIKEGTFVTKTRGVEIFISLRCNKKRVTQHYPLSCELE